MSQVQASSAIEGGAAERTRFGSLHSQLVITFIGGVLILNSWLADKFLFPGQQEIGAFSAMLGAILLGAFIVRAAVKEMASGRMHMSVLVALAVLAAFSLSEPGSVGSGAGYRVAGIVALFMLLATLIEQRTAEGARTSVEQLMRFQPRKAELVGGEIVDVSQLKPGDSIRLRPGDRVPADGRIVEGETTMDEATITGESLPADKAAGEEVFAGTHNLTGAIVVEVIRAGEDTTLGKVKRLILEAEATKTRLMQLVDRYAIWYAPVVLMIVFVVYLMTDGDVQLAITLLVLACPCAFVLATPTAMVAGLTAAARLGVLVKNVGHLEVAGSITAVVFDKTGTLTTGELTVTRLSPAPQVEGATLLQTALTLEQNSRHPVARAVVGVAERANIMPLEASGVQEVAGRGVQGLVGGEEALVGRGQWLEDQGVDMSTVPRDKIPEVEGMSLLFVGRAGRCIGWIALEDRARPEAQQATSELKELGVRRLTMLTGDRWSVARKVAGELGCTEVQAECLPEHKLRLVEAMRAEGNTVAVVGDGVNDAPALVAGDLGIAMGAAGSDVAIGSASIALMSNDLGRLPWLVRLSRQLKRVILQNLGIGLVFMLGFAVLAALKIIGPIEAAAVQIVSSFIVIFNSARLVRFGENLLPHNPAAAESDATAARTA
ncbi:MAG: cation-translocating P-type ATPase [Candidatus Brocadiia bacterium]|nr:cation-translocating P-type ATPase [Candidatus Brocadiia bacterium]